MSYSFCFGPSGSGKSRLLRQIIIEKAQKSLAGMGRDRTKYIVIVPEQYSMQTQRELVQEHPAHVLMNIDVLSFGRLAHRVFEETGADRRTVLDDIGKSLLLRRVASRCADDLEILRRGIHRPGMIDEVKSVLSEFMQYGIGGEQIEEMAAFAGEHGQRALQARLHDLKKLYEQFKSAEADSYITSEETLDLLAKAIPNAGSLKGSVIVFDGFTGFTTVQYRVVMALIRCAREVVFSFTVSPDQGAPVSVTASGGPAGSEENLFYLSRRTVYDIIRMASKEGLKRGKDLYAGLPLPGREETGRKKTDPEKNGREKIGHGENDQEKTGSARGEGTGEEGAVLPRFQDSRVLAHLERHLFRYPERAFEERKQGETSDSLQLFAASSPQEEVRLIFGRVRRMIAQTGCAYRDFAIVTADLETYGDLFALEAERAGIPVYIDRTSGAFHNILIEGIRSVLQISSENFSYPAVFRYLRSGLSSLTEDETDRLENYCLANGIRGRKKWTMAFDASCEEARIKFLREVEPVTGLSVRVLPGALAGGGPEAGTPGAPAGSGPQAGNPVGPGASDTAEAAQAAEAAEKPRRARTAAVRTRELYDFLAGCGAQARVEALADSFGESGDVVRELQYRQIYRHVIDLLDQIYDLAGQERMSARDYLELLEAGFSQIRLGTLPQRVDRILVGDIERTRLTQISHLFVAGVNEGSIPRSASRGGILSDMDREFLASSGAVLAPTPRQQMFTQRLYLYLNMTKPSRTLTISFATVSRDGRSLRPSYLISMLQALFPALQTEFPEQEPVRGRITGRADSLSLLADQLRTFVEGRLPDAEAFMRDFSLLYGFHTSPEVMADGKMRQAILRLRGAALSHYRPQVLQSGLAQALYGRMIIGGISRMETGARCYLRQHLQYGLHLRERDQYEFRAVDGGSILHAALQRFDALLRAEGLSWTDFSARDAERLGIRALQDEAAVYRNLLLYKSSRDEGRLGRYARRLLRTIDTLQYQISKGDFVPVASELSFGGRQGGMPAIRFELGDGRSLVLTGRIDRFDMCAEGNRRYLRIMDYKTGRNDLDEDLIRRGLQLQLITYMEALLNAGAGRLDALAAGGSAQTDPIEESGFAALSPDVSGQNSPDPAAAAEGSGQEEIGVPVEIGGPEEIPFEEGGEAGQRGGEEEIIPSAMLYYRMNEPVIRKTAADVLPAMPDPADTDTESAAAGEAGREELLHEEDAAIRSQLRPTGLVYEDEDSISHLHRSFSGRSDVIPVTRSTRGGYTAASRLMDDKKYRELAQMAREALCRLAVHILDGDVSAQPAVLDAKTTACDYCPYREACGFDPRIPGYTYKKDQ